MVRPKSTQLDPLMKDLKNPVWIKAKAVLFVLLGMLSTTLLILEKPTLRVAGLLAICIWCFCRVYYFVFYVIEHYIDSSYRFSSLWSFAVYVFSRRRPGAGPPT
jgi:hypothetical protein